MHSYSYLVIENAPDVCEGIIRRMNDFTEWKSLGYCTGISDALMKIESQRPSLLFMDWSLNGGSAFEILENIQNHANHHPYIIFFTGFQRDNPEIPVEIINKYRVDKYLVKPVWENLRLHLKDYLEDAKAKIDTHIQPNKRIWIEDVHHHKHLTNLANIAFICQHTNNPRWRSIFFYPKTETLEIKVLWQNVYELLNKHEIDFFVTKNRGHLVVRDFVEKFEKPFVRIRGYNTRIEVVKESIRAFEEWLTKSPAIQPGHLQKAFL